MSAATVDDLAALLRPDGGAGTTEPAKGWPAVLDLAAQHRLHPALWAALTERGVRPVPDAVRAATGDGRSPLVVLEDAYRANEVRVDALSRQVRKAMRILGAAGVAAVPIKGAHWFLASWMLDPAARTTVDVDLLVDRAAAQRGQEALLDAGYDAVGGPLDEWADHQLAALVDDGPVALELHVAPIWSLHGGLLDADEVRRNAEAISTPDGEALVPSATDAATLLIGHAQLQDLNHRFGGVPLRALHDLSLLESTGAFSTVDWDVVQARFDRIGEDAALSGFAAAARRWFAIELPVDDMSGSQWVESALGLLDDPAQARRHERRAMLALTFSSARMDRLYGTTGPVGRTWARARHVGRGVLRRARPGG